MPQPSTPAPEIPELDIASFVLAGAAEHPDKPALIDGPSGRSLTYGELDAATAKLAGALASRGIGKGDSVSVYMPNLPETFVAFFAILKIGPAEERKITALVKQAVS